MPCGIVVPTTRLALGEAGHGDNAGFVRKLSLLDSAAYRTRAGSNPERIQPRKRQWPAIQRVRSARPVHR